MLTRRDTKYTHHSCPVWTLNVPVSWPTTVMTAVPRHFLYTLNPPLYKSWNLPDNLRVFLTQLPAGDSQNFLCPQNSSHRSYAPLPASKLGTFMIAWRNLLARSTHIHEQFLLLDQAAPEKSLTGRNDYSFHEIWRKRSPLKYLNLAVLRL